MSPEAERDQIIRSLQSAVQNRKPSTEVQAVALNGNDMKKAAGVAKDNNCDYVLLTLDIGGQNSENAIRVARRGAESRGFARGRRRRQTYHAVFAG